MKARMLKTGMLFFSLAILQSCTTSLFSPTTSTNTSSNAYTSLPKIKASFLTSTNMVKIGISKSLGASTFSPLVEFYRLDVSDLNPTGYSVFEGGASCDLGYAWYNGTSWSGWIRDATTNRTLVTNTTYVVYLSGTLDQITNSQGTLQLSKN